MFSVHNNPRAVARVGVREAVADCFEARIDEARIDARMEEARIEDARIEDARIEDARIEDAAEFHYSSPRHPVSYNLLCPLCCRHGRKLCKLVLNN